MRFALFPLRLALAIASLAVAAITLAGLGGAVNLRLDLVNHGAPMSAAAGLALLAAVRLAFGRGRVRLALTAVLLAGLAGQAAIVGPELAARLGPSRATATTGTTLKLVTFNMLGPRTDPDRFFAFLDAEDPDILVLQEATRAAKPILDRLAARFPGRVGNGSYDRQEVAAFTKLSIVDASVPAFPDRADAAVGKRRFLTGGGHFLVAKLALPDQSTAQPITLMTVHLSWPIPIGRQAAQMETLAGLIGSGPRGRVLLAGDFNATPWSFALKGFDKASGLTRVTRALFSWPALSIADIPYSQTFPVLPIDHVYAGTALRPISVRRGPRLGSDHYPIVATFAVDDER